MVAFVLPQCILGVIFLRKKDCWIGVGLLLEGFGEKYGELLLCASFRQFGRRKIEDHSKMRSSLS